MSTGSLYTAYTAYIDSSLLNFELREKERERERGRERERERERVMGYSKTRLYKVILGKTKKNERQSKLEKYKKYIMEKWVENRVCKMEVNR